MFLINWLRQYKQLRREFEPEVKPCESCETLRSQLEYANRINENLMNRILEKPEPERTMAPEPVPFKPPSLPWISRRQILEREDREKARAMRNAPKPDSATSDTTIEELERELGVAEQLRERESSSGGGA